MLSLSDIADDLRYVLSSGQATLGHVINKSSNDNEFNHLLERIMESTGEMNQDDTEEPFGTVYYPIRSQTNATSVVGILGATFRWSKLISDAAVSRTSHCVLDIDKDSKSFSFAVKENKAVYFANADARDKQKYISAKTWDFFTNATASYTMSKSQKTQSRFSFRVYPATATRNKSSAGIYAALVAVMFILLTMLFLLYDCIVQRRQKQVHEAVLRSTKIVSSLFPNQVADRLFQNHADHDACSKDVEQDDMEESQVKAAFLSHQNHNAPGLIKEPPKHKLKQVLKDSGNMYDDLVMNQSDKPIADFFPACTVLFADIAGFTAFASERPPEQVFQLLQAVYQAFDKAARKRHVFKVETIGDCYVAVTGLPDRQPNHAEIMAGFALHCRSKMKEVTRKLERILGPDTSSLVMRFGLHSGPVIAGVLRGERARFQLFGDTVNTAARMESTGQRDRVQVSEATANLLIEAGKGSWVTPREDLVSAKGKGQMQTFWLESREAYSQRTKLMSQISCDSFDGMPEEKCPEAPWQTSATGREAMKTAKHEIWARSEIDMPPPTTLRRSASDATCRLIDWNTQILLNLLKPVVAHRVATKGFAFQPDDSVLSSLISDEGNTLDEVREIIELPRLDTSQPIQHVDPDSIELDGDVEGQLRDFVTGIASMYRDNPFHNYAHACHVQMSMIKLLQRVVSPDSVDYRGAKDSVASDVHNYTFGITSDPLTSFAVVWAALIHDVDHCGVSNGQLVKENAPVATFYKGKSVAEQNSIDLAWELLMQPNFRELRSCIFADQSELNRFRQITVNIVISTDIFDPQLKALRDQRWQKAFSEASLSEPVHVQVNRKATIVLEHLIQASDVSHTMQHWEIYRKWNERLFFEMHLAFKTGRVDGVCPSVGWYKGEIGFFDFYIIPLAKKLKDCGVFGVSSDECLTNALENRRIWVERGEDIVKEMLEMNYLEKMDEGKKTRRSRRKQNKLSISFED
ncbi:hypothetical protein MPSEU_000823900 [Mayamaea pseudoterrestris]|nr:hypothetical protein MPSEU_000823900 [Mayamaea pseudoterrestris]